MRHIILLFAAMLIGTATMQAQMATDNSYLRENYRNSKTAQKAAAKKAAKKARKAEAAKQKAANAKPKAVNTKQKAESTTAKPYYVKAKDGSVTTKDKLEETNANIDAPYLAGAVPTTTEGIVSFERTFDIAALGKDKALEVLKSVAQEIIDSPESAHEISRIMQEGGDTLIATICEPIYFKRAKWETDSALIRYQYLATVAGQTATVRLWLISYSYEEIGFGYKAEQWITDKYALTKDKLALRKGSGKFRKKTVDYANELFARIEDRLKIEH